VRSGEASVGLLRRRARVIADLFASTPLVEAVCLFGSVARGDTNEWSDVDLLVVGSDPTLTPTALLRELPEDLRNIKLTLLYYLPDELESMFTTGLSFADHLKQEGVVLYDRSGFLTSLLAGEKVPATKEEVEARLEQLEAYSDLSIFKDNFLFVLARLYNIGKALVMFELSHENEPVFNRDAAFARLAQLHPGLSEDVTTIERLRPFYRLVTRGVPEALPFPYRGAEQEVRAAILAIRRLAGTMR